jgi:hypothetical protein
VTFFSATNHLNAEFMARNLNQNAVHSLEETHYVSATKTKPLVAFREAVAEAVYCGNKYAPCRFLWYDKADGTNNNLALRGEMPAQC